MSEIGTVGWEQARAERAEIRVAELGAALDLTTSIAVLYFEESGHHDPESVPVIMAARAALKPQRREPSG